MYNQGAGVARSQDPGPRHHDQQLAREQCEYFSIRKERNEKERLEAPVLVSCVSALIRIKKSHVQMAAMAARLLVPSALQFCTQLLMKLIGYVSG